MSKLLSSVLVAALVAGLATVGPSPAQDKKKDAKTAQPVKGGVVEVNESKDGKFRFTVRDADGKYLGGSATGYATKDDAVKAVAALKAALATAKIEFGKKDEKDEKK
ncbi:DUF1508 domain-containing protein [bacterium]|nr:DUF1508 domain-containing protein [bacterium]